MDAIIGPLFNPLFRAVVIYITTKYGGHVWCSHLCCNQNIVDQAYIHIQLVTINIKRPESDDWQSLLRNPTVVFIVKHVNDCVTIDNSIFEYNDPRLFDHIDNIINNRLRHI